MKTASEEPETFDLESEWPETRWFRSGGSDAGEEALWIFPVLLLYVGFFFGPFVTVLTSIFALRGQISLRLAAILTGVAGTCWCLLQGFSVVYGPVWSEVALQGMRSSINFANGIVAYVCVRQIVAGELKIRPKTFVISGLVVLIAAALFFLTPGRLLVALGR